MAVKRLLALAVVLFGVRALLAEGLPAPAFAPTPFQTTPIVITGPDFNLSWTYGQTARVDGYYIYESVNLVYGSTPYKTVMGGTTLSTRVNSPNALGIHNFMIRAFQGTTLSPPSPNVSADFQMEAPGSPVITAEVVEAEKFSATVRWLTNRPASSIVAFGEVALNRIVAMDELTLEHEILLSGLKNHRVYLYQLRSVASDGQQALSNVGRFITS